MKDHNGTAECWYNPPDECEPPLMEAGPGSDTLLLFGTTELGSWLVGGGYDYNQTLYGGGYDPYWGFGLPFLPIPPIFYDPCIGTTDCSYYEERCQDPQVPNKSYYCHAAPIACQNAGQSRVANCIRLCLQVTDTCWDKQAGIGFTACVEFIHAGCYAKCFATPACYF